MSSRGRPTAVKRGVLPNLALAGKREEKSSQSHLKRKKNAQSPFRGGRGRGRGKDFGKERPGLIESSGIFSEGLSGADPSRRIKPVKMEVTETVSRVKEETVEDGGEKRSGYAGYDELWESDEEGDMQELSELLRDGFISDYKHGTILPHVLPLELQSQFVDLMDKSVQKDLIDEEETLKSEMETDTKERIFAEMIDEREVDDGESPTSKHSRKAARILRSMTTEARENDLFMIQLPSILKVLSQEKVSENKVVLNNNRPNGTAKLDGREGETLSGTSEKITVEQLRLPHGRCIGKLVVTRDGRVKLNVGGHSMDVAHTASEGQHQGVVMVETAAQPHEEGYGLHNGHGRFGNPSGGDSNAIYYLGHVRHHLTASLDWKQLRPIGVENTANAATDEVASPSRKPKSADVDRLRKELNDLQKQRSKDISAALKRWNA